MKTNNASRSSWIKRASGFIAILVLALSFSGQAHARILFQDDAFQTFNSEGITINNDDTGDQNATLKFGNDGTDGKITWGDSTSTLTVGDGVNNIAVNSAGWDISAAGVASGLTGLTSSGTVSSTGTLSSTGVVNFSAATRLALQSGTSNPVGTCTEGDIFYNTTNHTTYTCTDTSAHTWTALSIGTPTFEQIYAGDTSLSTSDGSFTITAGAGNINLTTTSGDTIVNSNDWNVTADGDLDAASITSNGALTATGTTTLNGTANLNGITNIGDGGDAVTITSTGWNIGATGDMTGIGAITADGNFSQTGATTFSTGTGTVSVNGNTTIADGKSFTANGTATIGDDGDTVQVKSSSWDISTGGAATGFTGLTSSGTVSSTGALNATGTVDFSGATSTIPTKTGATDPASCSVGMQFFNTTTNDMKVCTSSSPVVWSIVTGNNAQLTFSPEYPDVVVYSDGADNKGTLAADYDNTNREHFYRWSTAQSALEDIDLRFRAKLPTDFVTPGDMTFRFRTQTTDTADSSVNITVRNDTDNTTCKANGAVANTTQDTWETITISDLATLCTGATALNAGDTIEVQIKLSANNASAGYADVGTVSFAYTN